MKKLNLSRLAVAAFALLHFASPAPAQAAPQRRAAKRGAPAPAAAQPQKTNAPAQTRQGAATTTDTGAGGTPAGAPTANASKKNARSGGDTPPTANAGASDEAEASGVRYGYEFKQPGSYLFRVQIEHDAAGRGRVTFERQVDTGPITEEFKFSPAALARVAKLWESLGALEPEGGYQSEKQFPHMGTTRLQLTRAGRTRSAEFNWTEHPEAEALAKEYRNAAEQAILAFELAVALENQPLETPKLLTRFERLVEVKGLSDARQMAPLLRQLREDERVPLVARNHAARLLKKLEKAEKQESR